jgi:iron complex transport system substrate-binding protein
MINPSLENLLSLRPDLVLMSMEGNIRDDYERLRSMAIPVAVSDPRAIEGIYRTLQMLGTLTGCRASADSLVGQLRQRERMLRARVDTSRVRVLMFVSVQPLIAVGGRTFVHELLVAAGGVNLAGAPSLTYPAYSREAVIEQDPDAIVITSDAIADSSAVIRLFPEWSRLRAFRSGRVYMINADVISRPGPRALDGLQQLIMSFHGPRL